MSLHTDGAGRVGAAERSLADALGHYLANTQPHEESRFAWVDRIITRFEVDRAAVLHSFHKYVPACPLTESKIRG